MSMHAPLVAAAMAAFLSLPADAQREPIVVDPHVGGTGAFEWAWNPEYGIGPLSADSWQLTPTHDQWIDFRLRDESYPGDNFSAIVNGVPVPWDRYIAGVGNRFLDPGFQWADGELQLLLRAGLTYTLTIDPTPCSSGCSFGGGGIYWITPVPEPAAWAALLAGLVLLGVRLSASTAGTGSRVQAGVEGRREG